MSATIISTGIPSRLCTALVGLIVLAGCGGGSTSSSTSSGTPAVTLSPTFLTFSSGVGAASAAQTVTVTYTSASSYGSFLDSGSNGLFVSDYSTLSAALKTTVSDCSYDNTDIYYYCPSSTLTVPLTVAGTNGTSTTVDFSIANALNLFSSGNSTFNNLGGESGSTGASTDSWDLGLPFFFGKTIFFGISGTTVGNVTATEGYYAF